MLDSIVDSIIVTEYDQTLGRTGSGKAGLETSTSIYTAMEVTFSLKKDYDVETGYRNLTVLIFGGGSNYIGVYGKLDWTVAKLDIPDGEEYQYVEGSTAWVLFGCHDSGWREAGHRIIRQYRDKILTIGRLKPQKNNVDKGWYKQVTFTEEERQALWKIRTDCQYINLEDLDFHFEGAPIED